MMLMQYMKLYVGVLEIICLRFGGINSAKSAKDFKLILVLFVFELKSKQTLRTSLSIKSLLV